MEIIGNLSMILPMQGGVSQQSGNQWQKATFILDQPSNNPNYPNPKKVCVTTMNANVIATLQQFPVGTPLKVAISVESREYNGRWYTDVIALKIEQFLPQQQGAAVPQQQGTGAASVPQPTQGMQGGGYQQPVGQQMPAQPQFAAPAAQAPQQPLPNDLPF